jgi:peroxiredoxin Q/BCP
MILSVGQLAPDFTLPDQEGKIHMLSSYRGQMVVVYFYPKDDTPGCTKEACAFRDNLPQFKKLKIPVIGISTDTSESHQKFAQKYQLPFTLLADEHKKVVEAYGVWGVKKFMGRAYTGVARTSFLIDQQGKVLKIYEQVKPEKHVLEVLDDLTHFLA